MEYHHATVEELSTRPGHAEGYDAVCAMEIVEHLAPGTLETFVQGCAACLRPGGVLVVSTINRTAASYALAIVAAEDVLRWVEPGTHSWDKFVTVEECTAAMAASGLRSRDGEMGPATGMVYRPWSGWTLSDDTDVNYLCSAIKPP